MNLTAQVLAKLIGGPQDGETILMQPCPGIGPPHHLTFYSKRQEWEKPVYVVDVYEACPPMVGWPDEGEGEAVSIDAGTHTIEIPDAVSLEYHWIGVFHMTSREDARDGLKNKPASTPPL